MNSPRQQYGQSSGDKHRWTEGFKFFLGDKLNPQWVGDHAKQFSIMMAKNGLTSSQLRAFYNEFIRIRDITADAEEKNVLIRLLAAKISYRHTARKKEMPEDMVEFISNLVDQIDNSTEKFKKACHVMEAVVGFFPKKD